MARDIGLPNPECGRPNDAIDERADDGVGDERAGVGDAGDTVDEPRVFVKQRDQMFALIGIMTGLLGFAPGSEAWGGIKNGDVEGCWDEIGDVAEASWSYTASMCVGRSASDISKLSVMIGTSKRKGGGTPSSNETRFTL